jgi:acetoin:2,6-dichlorophenolindophenol oxidoreductase subunit alpha
MLAPEILQRLYVTMYRIRVFETRCIALYRAGDIRGYFHPSLGQEGVAAGVCAALGPDDSILSTHRGHGHCIARGMRTDRMVAELLGKDTGYCRGRGGSMHIADAEAGNLGANGIVGAGIPMAVGAALAYSIRGESRLSVVFFSDGAANNGVFAESMNLAAIWNLPVLLVLENNQYAATTPVEATSRNPVLSARAAGYGVAAEKVDGNDVEAVYDAALRGRALCMSGKGPFLLEALTYRHMGHHVNDPGTYMPAEKLAMYKEHRDPVVTARAPLVEALGEAAVRTLEAATEAEIEEAVAFGRNSPEPGLEEFLLETRRFA